VQCLGVIFYRKIYILSHVRPEIANIIPDPLPVHYVEIGRDSIIRYKNPGNNAALGITL
jgi:hypothetical protein